MTALEFVVPTEIKHFSSILFGPHGSGKTVAAASAPDPIVYLNADRKDGLRFARKHFPDKDIRELPVTGIDTLYNTVLYVQEHPDVETVVLDSMGKIYDRVLRSIAKNDKHPTLPEHGDCQTHIKRFVEALIELPVNVVLVAHDMTVEVAGMEQDGTLRREQVPFVGTSNPAMANSLMRDVSIVAFCGAMGTGDERRWVAQVTESDGRRAKDNTGAIAALGEYPEANLTAWAEAIDAYYADPTPTNNSKETK